MPGGLLSAIFDKAAYETITANFYFRKYFKSNRHDSSDPSSPTATGVTLLAASAAVEITL
jgi:hypothetical protein